MCGNVEKRRRNYGKLEHRDQVCGIDHTQVAVSRIMSRHKGRAP
jgi:hypothetical protein